MRTVESGTWLRACVLAYDKENTHHRADVIKQAEVALGSEIQCQWRPDGVACIWEGARVAVSTDLGWKNRVGQAWDKRRHRQEHIQAWSTCHSCHSEHVCFREYACMYVAVYTCVHFPVFIVMCVIKDDSQDDRNQNYVGCHVPQPTVDIRKMNPVLGVNKLGSSLSSATDFLCDSGKSPRLSELHFFKGVYGG